MSEHLCDEQILGLLGGTLPHDELRNAEAHLWQCADCRDALRRRTEPAPDLPPLAAPRSEAAALESALPRCPAMTFRARPGAENFLQVSVVTGSPASWVRVVSASCYKGYDDDLQRDVAIKVPHRDRIATPEDAETYLAEARILASLDHPHIVPVHDLGK